MVLSVLAKTRIRLLALMALAVLPGLAISLVNAVREHDENVTQQLALAAQTAAAVAEAQHSAIDTARQVLNTLAFVPDLTASDRAVCMGALQRALATLTQFTRIVAYDREGHALCADSETSSANVFDNDDLIKRSLDRQGFVMGGYRHGRQSGQPIVLMVQPVFAETGTMAFLIRAGFDLTRFSRGLEQIGLPATASAFLVDPTGIVLAAHPEPERWIGRSVAATALFGRAVGAGVGAFESDDFEGAPRIVATRPVSAGLDGLRVFVALDASAQFARSAGALVITVVLLLLLAAATFWLAWLAADRLILRWVRRLVEVTRAIAAGDLSARIGAPYSGSELGQLAQACDAMAQQLDERTRALTVSEARAEQARDRFADVIESASEAIVFYDEEDHLVLFNARFREFLPKLSERIQPGMTFADICRIAAESGQFTGAQNRVDTWVAECLEQRRHPDRPFDRSTGERWLRSRERVTRSGGTVGVYTDITAIKTAEFELESRIAELEASRDQMEAQSRQLAALAESYAEARRQAEYANRAKSEFLARMSHELRTPLNAIIGFSDVMLGSMFGPLGSPRYHEYVTDIRGCGRHLLAVINDILDLAKIEAGRFELSESNVNPAHVVVSCLRFVRERAQRTGIVVATAVEADLPMVNADERALKQIMVNLLTNAVKFTPKGGTVTAFARQIATGELVMGVADTGIGMAPNEIPHALKPFGRIKNAGLADNEATGLGLPLVKSMVELHGGRLEIESEVGVGTTATVYLPAARVVRQLAQAM